jgi:hypothetical protein
MSSNYSTYFQNHANQGTISSKIFNCNQTSYQLINTWYSFTVVGSLYRRTSVVPLTWQGLGHNVFQFNSSSSGSASNNFSYVNEFYQQDFNAGISNVPRTANVGDGGLLARNFKTNLNGGFYYSTYSGFHSTSEVFGIDLTTISIPQINVESQSNDDGMTEYNYGHIYLFYDTDLLQDPNEEEDEEEEDEEEEDDDQFEEEDTTISSYQVCLMKTSDSDLVLDDTSVSYSEAILNNYKISGDKAYVISITIS